MARHFLQELRIENLKILTESGGVEESGRGEVREDKKPFGA
jgi:hypothetical protein